MKRIFTDTNLLVYAVDASAAEKHTKANALWTSLLQSQDRPVISMQVLQEYYNCLTKKLRTPPQEARLKITLLRHIEIIPMDYPLLLSAIDLCAAASISFWDALIVAAAPAANCDELWTEDLQTGRQFGRVKIVNPFNPA